MTQNQLRFWELRWKQHYESIYVGEIQRSNRAKEAETERHNRKEEKIATQQLVIERQKLSLAWAELSERVRATMVKEAIDWENAKTNRYNAQIRAGELEVAAYKAETERTKVMNELQQKMIDQQTVLAELYLDAVESFDKADRDRWKTAVDLAKDAFKIKGEVNFDPDLVFGDNNFKITAEGDLGKWIYGIMSIGRDKPVEMYKDVFDTIKAVYPKSIELYGPQATERVKVDALGALDQHRLVDRGIEDEVQRKNPNASHSFKDAKTEVTKTVGSNPDSKGIEGPGFSNTGRDPNGGLKSSAVIGPKLSQPVGPGFN